MLVALHTLSGVDWIYSQFKSHVVICEPGNFLNKHDQNNPGKNEPHIFVITGSPIYKYE